MIKESIEAIVSGRDLAEEEAAQAMEEIMSGQATPAQIASFITALRIKGETVEEITGLAKVMRAKAVPVKAPFPVFDTCGTGGDNLGTFNISTVTAFVVAGAGLKVAKHGNRAVTSGCGSADVLEQRGVKIDLGPEGVMECLEKADIGFMFAPLYHPSFKHATAPRKEIGIRTVFNMLGPLTNPASPQGQVIGVAHGGLAEKMIRVLKRLGSKHALVVHGEDGLDEVSVCNSTQVWELKDDNIVNYTVTPEELGLPRATLDKLKGGVVERNAAIMLNVLSGDSGPPRDVIVANAAAALVAGDKVATLQEGVKLAQEALDSGEALKRLELMVDVSHRHD